MKIFQRIFAYVYDRGMRSKEKTLLGPKREALLSGLSGTVLEIGSGTGINFQWYADEVKVTALEPSIYMSEQSTKRIGEKKIDIIASTIQEAIDNHLLNASGYDHIVCTLVLCSIPNYVQAIDKIISLLKPGGTLIVLEHIASTNKVIIGLQNMFNPMQNCVADGCNLNRKTDIVLKNTNLACLQEEYFGYFNVLYKAVYKKK